MYYIGVSIPSAQAKAAGSIFSNRDLAISATSIWPTECHDKIEDIETETMNKKMSLAIIKFN